MASKRGRRGQVPIGGNEASLGSSSVRGDSTKRPRRTAADPQERARAQAESKMSAVLNSLKKHKHAGLFLTPVDLRTVPDYNKFVKTPMDLGTIEKKLKSGGYSGNIDAFTTDVRLVFTNCFAYNPPGDWARTWGESCSAAFEGLYNSKLAPLLEPATFVEDPEEGEPPQPKKLKVRLKKSGGGGGGSGSSTTPTKGDNSFGEDMEYSPTMPARHETRSGALKLAAPTSPKLSLAGARAAEDGGGGGGGGGGGSGKVLPKIRITFNASGKAKIAPPKDEASKMVPLKTGSAAAPSRQAANGKRGATHPSADPDFEPMTRKRTRTGGGSGGMGGSGGWPPGGDGQRPAAGGLSAGILKLSASRPRSPTPPDFAPPVLEEPQAPSPEAIRKRCIKQAQQALRKTALPFRSGPYEVISFGQVSLQPAYHDENFLFPPGYRCSHSHFVRINVKQYAGKRLVIRCDSEIMEQANGTPSFRVEHCGQLLAAADIGLAAWRAAMRLDAVLARRTVYRLVRCKSVLNRMCCSEDIIAFLESVSPAEVPDYHLRVSRPVHMRLVHDRLKRGGYLNEFAFASDMRLAWSNAKLYNRHRSELWEAADRLSVEFEALFCDWVINPLDRGAPQGFMPAKGPWDAWQYLRYFETFEECIGCSKARPGTRKTNISSAATTGNGVEGSAASAAAVVTAGTSGAPKGRPELTCSSCEDLWHAACLGETAAMTASVGAVEGRPFLCPRCTAWANGGGAGGGDVSSEGRAMLNTPSFQPHSSLPAGFQHGEDLTAGVSGAEGATDAVGVPSTGAGRQLFLTPVGTVVVGLTAAETFSRSYQSRVTADQKAKSGARKRDGYYPIGGQDGEDSAYYLHVTGFDRTFGSIDPAGSGPGMKADGHFGLSTPDIKIRVDGLQNVDHCSLYVIKEAAQLQEEAEQVAEEKARQEEAVQSLRVLLRSKLAEERWHWRRRRERAGEEQHSVSRVDTYAAAREQAATRRRDDASMMTGDASLVADTSHELVAPMLGDPEPLFPSDADLFGCPRAVEQSLMAWDFLSSFGGLMGYVVPPAKRLLEAIMTPTGKDAAVPAPSELAFSEGCMLLTKVLLMEVCETLRKHMSKKAVDQVIALRPLNLLTWPEVAADALIALVNLRAIPELRPSELVAIVSSRPSGWLARCGDMVAVLISQPLAAAFVRPVDPALVPGYADVVSTPMDLGTVRRRVWSRRYQWHGQVLEDLHLVWSNAKAFNQEGSDFWHAATSLALLTDALYEKWVLEPERLREAESMREAGLGAALVEAGVDSQLNTVNMENSAAVHTSAEPVVLGASAVVVVKAEAAPDDPPNGKPQTEQQATAALENAPATTVGPVDPSTSMKRTPMSADSAVDISIGENGSQVAGATATVTAAAAAAADKQLTSQVSMGDVKVAVKKEQQGEVHAAEGEEHDREDEGEDDEEDDDEYEGFARRNTAVRGSSRRPEPLPLRPSSVHPAFAGRRPLPKHESPASGRAYGLWDPESVHPAYFGHLRHGGEAAGAAGLSGWAGTGDGGAMDCALRVLRGLTDEGMLAGRSKPERNVEVKEDHGLKWSGGMGIVSWSPKERATVLGLLCEEASSTATALEYMEELVIQEAANLEEDDGDGEVEDEPFEAPGDDDALAPELCLAAAADEDVAAGGGRCCLCGGIKASGGSDQMGTVEAEPWVLVPSELKALPEKLLPRLPDLCNKQNTGVVVSTPTEGAEVLKSPLGPTWLKRLYHAPVTADADEGSKVSGTDKRELEEGGEESRGEEGWESDGNGEAKKEGDEGQARSISVVCPPREGDPFAARIAAHAACTRKLWRSRYLALREERRLRRREESQTKFPEFVNPPPPPRYDSYRQRYSYTPTAPAAPSPQYAATSSASVQSTPHVIANQGVVTQQHQQQYPQGQIAHSGVPGQAAAPVATVATATTAGTPAAPIASVVAYPALSAGVTGTSTIASTAGVAAASPSVHPTVSTTPGATAVMAVAGSASGVSGAATSLHQGQEHNDVPASVPVFIAQQAITVPASAPAVAPATATATATANAINLSQGALQGAAEGHRGVSNGSAPGLTSAPPITAPRVDGDVVTAGSFVAGGSSSAEAFIDVDTDDEGEVEEEELAKKMRAGFERKDSLRGRPLGRDRYGNEYWRLVGDRRLVLVRRHGCWWGLYEGPTKIQELVQNLNVDLDGERHLRNRLYEAIDVWGLTAKLETYLRNKRSARERAERAAGGGNASAWGVFGGGAGGVKKGKPEGAAALETRRREEAERIRGQLSRSYEPRQWERVNESREAWLSQEGRAFGKILPVEAVGSGNVSTDYRFVAASIRQQRLHSRSMELRQGEYLASYDDDRALAIDTAFREGKVEVLRQERGRVRMDLSEDVVENIDSKGWVRSDALSLTRELAAETRALRMLHLPDTRTAAQKRRDLEARAASTWSAGASANSATAGTSEPTTAREMHVGMPMGSAVGRQDASSSGDASGATTVKTESGAAPSTAVGSVGATGAARQGLALDVAGSPRAEETVEEGPRSLSPRPVSDPGYDEDDVNAERTYWEPSIATSGLLSPEMVKLKVEMLSLALCLPQKWERAASISSGGAPRLRIRQRAAPSPAPDAVAPEGAKVAGTPQQRPPSPTIDLGGGIVASSKDLAPELAAALKEAVEASARGEAGEDVDIGVDATHQAPTTGAVSTSVEPSSMSVDPAKNAVEQEASVKSTERETQPDQSITPVEGSVPSLTAAVSEEPDSKSVQDQPFVRKAQGTWLTVNSSDDDDFDDEDLGMEDTVAVAQDLGGDAATKGSITAAPGDVDPAPVVPSPVESLVVKVEDISQNLGDAPALPAKLPDVNLTISTAAGSEGTAPATQAPSVAATTEVTHDIEKVEAPALAAKLPDVNLTISTAAGSEGTVPTKQASSVAATTEVTHDIGKVEALVTEVRSIATDVLINATSPVVAAPDPVSSALKVDHESPRVPSPVSPFEVLSQVQPTQEIIPTNMEVPQHKAEPAAPSEKELDPVMQVSRIPVDLEDWRDRVRRAETAVELASLALELDAAIPRNESWLQPWYKTASFVEPNMGCGSSLAAAAIRVFALDRALRWDVIPRPRRGGTGLPGDLPRTWPFFHQCPMSPLCIRAAMHKGKCRHHRSGISRVDHPMLVPAPKYSPPYASSYGSSYVSSYASSYSTSYNSASAPVAAPPVSSTPVAAPPVAAPSTYAQGVANNHWVQTGNPNVVASGWSSVAAPVAAASSATIGVGQAQVQSQAQAQLQAQVQSQAQAQLQAQVQSHLQAQVQSYIQAQVPGQAQAPVQSHAQAQVQGLAQAPVQSHLQAHVQVPAQASVQSHLQPQVQVPAQAPAQSHVQAQVHVPAQSPIQSHIQAQVQVPAQAPVQSHLQPQIQGPAQAPAQTHLQPHIQGLAQAPVQPHVQTQVPGQAQAQAPIQSHAQAQIQDPAQAPVQSHLQAQVQGPAQAQIYPGTVTQALQDQSVVNPVTVSCSLNAHGGESGLTGTTTVAAATTPVVLQAPSITPPTAAPVVAPLGTSVAVPVPGTTVSAAAVPEATMPPSTMMAPHYHSLTTPGSLVSGQNVTTTGISTSAAPPNGTTSSAASMSMPGHQFIPVHQVQGFTAMSTFPAQAIGSTWSAGIPQQTAAQLRVLQAEAAAAAARATGAVVTAATGHSTETRPVTAVTEAATLSAAAPRTSWAASLTVKAPAPAETIVIESTVPNTLEATPTAAATTPGIPMATTALAHQQMQVPPPPPVPVASHAPFAAAVYVAPLSQSGVASASNGDGDVIDVAVDASTSAQGGQ